MRVPGHQLNGKKVFQLEIAAETTSAESHALRCGINLIGKWAKVALELHRRPLQSIEFGVKFCPNGLSESGRFGAYIIGNNKTPDRAVI